MKKIILFSMLIAFMLASCDLNQPNKTNSSFIGGSFIATQGESLLMLNWRDQDYIFDEAQTLIFHSNHKFEMSFGYINYLWGYVTDATWSSSDNKHIRVEINGVASFLIWFELKNGELKQISSPETSNIVLKTKNKNFGDTRWTDIRKVRAVKFNKKTVPVGVATQNGVNIRYGPEKNYNKYEETDINKDFFIIGQNGSWYNIVFPTDKRYEEFSLWIHKDFVRVIRKGTF